MPITIFQNKLGQVSSKVKRLVSQKPKCIWGATKQNKWPKQDGQKRQMSPMPETIKFYNKMKNSNTTLSEHFHNPKVKLHYLGTV